MPCFVFISVLTWDPECIWMETCGGSLQRIFCLLAIVLFYSFSTQGLEINI